MVKVSKGLADLDDIQFRMKCAIDLVDAVHEAMLNGSFTAETYTDALFGTRIYLNALNDELRLCIDEMLDDGKKEERNLA